ncbi:MAG: MAPEG family protein [Neomegalonema sp.]|nr:MAPEG family protein [Neomegalonema sp.]
MPYPVTALFCGLNTVIVLYLAIRVISLRRRHQVAIGDGGHGDLARAIRGHANAVETIPLILFLLLLSEGSEAPILVPLAFGTVTLIGRVLHGLHFAHPDQYSWRLRVLGMHLTIWPLLAMALGLIFHALFALAGISFSGGA